MRKLLQLSIVVLAGNLVCACAHAASFDCKLAKTAVEKAVCSDKELSADDDKLAASYKNALSMAPADVQTDIRADQREWSRDRSQCASVPGQPPVSQADLVSCLKPMYTSQIAVLDKWLVTLDGVKFAQRWKSQKAKSSSGSPAQAYANDPGYGTLTDTWPQALSDAPEWKAWNAAVLSATQGMAKLDGDTDSDVTTTIDAVTPQMVAVFIEDAWNGHGAAHPNETSVQLNWMLKEQRKLRVADVFRAGTGWAAVIEAQCRASMLAGVGADYEDFVGKDKFAGALHAIVEKPSNWQLNSKGLTIVFQDYQLESHAARPENVTVSWSALQRFLNPGFVVPR